MVKITLAPQYEGYRTFLASMPDIFENQGELIYKGRNILKKLVYKDKEFIVKKYAEPGFIRSVAYTLTSSKAHRAYFYGRRMLEEGFNTPVPIAAIEVKRKGLLSDSYFICEPDYSKSLLDEFKENGRLSHETVGQLTHLIMSLHEKGIFHGDLNLSNILSSEQGLVLIDTNRTRFINRNPGVNRRLQNLIRLTHDRRQLSELLGSYAELYYSSLLVSGRNSGVKKEDFVRDFTKRGIKAIERREKKKDIVHAIFGKSHR